ncbi:TetR/AcrR family transcriptional regulator [Pantoea dispersa]|uniref:TetR/AcrR family transcriptional regulator n=1 Tax=Pantoea dispersa TaxID=59814 RepID=UPI0021C7CEB2|nr:TetR-like C-terminal domain-containing protein [Pantoea dispersa]UXO70904.1 TetR/AcrR family transcriptional regulator [Pantoea dispersa]
MALMNQGKKSIATRRRGAQLEDAILNAAWDLLLEQGYNGFTYEAVAARAKTSRAVLHRRWPQRNDLLLAATQKAWQAQLIEVPDTGSLRGDALALLRHADVGRVRMLTLMNLQITDFFRETGINFSQLRKRLGDVNEPGPCEVIVARAVARSELTDKQWSTRVINLPLDLYRHEVFMTMQPVSEDVVLEIIDDIWLPLLRMP